MSGESDVEPELRGREGPQAFVQFQAGAPVAQVLSPSRSDADGSGRGPVKDREEDPVAGVSPLH